MIFILIAISSISIVACIFLYLCAREYERKYNDLINNRVLENIIPNNKKSKKLTIDDIKEYPPYCKDSIKIMKLINEDTKIRIKEDLMGGKYGVWNKTEVKTWCNIIIEDAENDIFKENVTFKPKNCKNKDFSYSLYRYSSKRQGDIWIGLHNIIEDDLISTCVLPQEVRYKYYRIKDVLKDEKRGKNSV